jgi:hypothetical protein
MRIRLDPAFQLPVLAICLFLTGCGASPASAPVTPNSAVVETSGTSNVLERSSFATGTIAPFQFCTYEAPNYGAIIDTPAQSWFAPDSSLAAPAPNWIHNTGYNLGAQVWWTQVGYDGTRERRGTEACSDVTVASEGWYGFTFYPPTRATFTTTYPNDKLGAIAQIFQDGYCNSWGALLLVDHGALQIEWRDYCGTANVIPLATSIKYDQWNPIIIHWVASNNNTGQLQVWYGDDVKTPDHPTYDAQNINFGFAHNWATGAPLPADSQQVLKFGMYNFDDGNYTPGETRTMFYDNVTQLSGASPTGWWQVNPIY